MQKKSTDLSKIITGQNVDKIMEGEIFGPVLPILVCRDIKEAIQIIKAKPKCSCVYIYSQPDND